MKEITLIECQAISAGCDVCGGKNKETIDDAAYAIGTGIFATFTATIAMLWYLGF